MLPSVFVVRLMADTFAFDALRGEAIIAERTYVWSDKKIYMSKLTLLFPADIA